MAPESLLRADWVKGGARVQSTTDLYEVRSRKDHRGVDLISDALPFGRLWYGGPNALIGLKSRAITLID
jgi:hypothetical protein